MRENLTQYCASYDREDLLGQWHPEKNGELSPDSVSYGNQKMIWWRREHGHEWQSPPYSRVGRSSGCPYCGGRRTGRK